MIFIFDHVVVDTLFAKKNKSAKLNAQRKQHQNTINTGFAWGFTFLIWDPDIKYCDTGHNPHKGTEAKQSRRIFPAMIFSKVA